MTERAPCRWCDSTLEALARLEHAGLPLRRNDSLAPFTTYRVGGPAAATVTVTEVRQLESIAAAITDGFAGNGPAVEVLVIGKGSNLLVSDAGFDGLALVLGPGFEAIDIEAATSSVRLGGAVLLPVAARATVRAGLTGFEWAVGVPGTVGGAVAMNAGGHGSDMAASVVAVTVFDLASSVMTRRSAVDLEFGYRHSSIGTLDVVLEAELQLEAGTGSRETQSVETQSVETLSEIVRWRREHQPGGSNAGSVFANPPNDSAGRLIDEAGLKGFRLGSAEVSAKHANFIQADADGSADDVYRLIRFVQATVAERTGVELRPENRLVGFGSSGQGPRR